MTHLLSPDDLAELTGYTRTAEQKKWLVDVGIPFVERNNNTLVLTWQTVNYALIGSDTGAMPDLSALDKLG